VLATASAPASPLFTLHALGSVIQGGLWLVFLLVAGLPRLLAEREAVARALAEDPRPAIVEQSWFATRLGRPPVVIPFLAAQLEVAGLWSHQPLVDAVARGDFGRIVVSFDLEGETSGGHADRFHPVVLRAMRDRYRLLTRDAGLYVYAPK